MAEHIYLQANANTMNYRGVAGPNDDPAGFKNLMAKKDLIVLISDVKLEAGSAKEVEGKNFIINDKQATLEDTFLA